MKYTPTRDLADIATDTLGVLNKRTHLDVQMTFTTANNGRAKIHAQRFSIPQHAFRKGNHYLIYYVVHEFTHCHLRSGGHGPSFKVLERNHLKKFGITIRYARAYPKELYANGECAYTKRASK